MTRAQTVAGAMGLASWRAHWTLNEYAGAATGGGAVFSRSGRPRFNHSLDPLGLNEVGVTDAVLATLWQFGPGGAAYGVSARAENQHFGADIAFVDIATKRILLYQAKRARFDGADLKLKSPVPVSHVGHLTRSSVRIGLDKFAVTGRLALYQIEHTPFLSQFAALPSWSCAFGWPVGGWHPSDGDGGLRNAHRPARALGVSTTRRFSSTDAARPEACSRPPSPADRARSVRYRLRTHGRGSSTSSTGINRSQDHWIRLLGAHKEAARLLGTSFSPSSRRTNPHGTVASKSARPARSRTSFDGC